MTEPGGIPGGLAAACAAAAAAQRTYDRTIAPDLAAASSEVYVTDGILGPGLTLSWRGSTDALDWARNISAWPGYDAFFDLYIHSGFLAAHGELAQSVEALLRRRDWPSVDLVGHSKGAATALLMALDLVKLGHPPRSVWLFGCPRVVWDGGAAADLAGVPILRFVNGFDLVTRQPAAWWGWRHVGPAIAIGEPVSPIGDHLMEVYCHALSRGDFRMSEPKPWYRSRGVLGGVLAAAASVAAAVGVDPAIMAAIGTLAGVDMPAADPRIVQALTAVAGGGGVLAVVGRLFGRTPIRRSSEPGGSALLKALPLLVAGSLVMAVSAPLAACTTAEAVVDRTLDGAETAVGTVRGIGEEVVDRAYVTEVRLICAKSIRAHQAAMTAGVMPAAVLPQLCPTVKAFVQQLGGAE